jgi:hypothetical protein
LWGSTLWCSAVCIHSCCYVWVLICEHVGVGSNLNEIVSVGICHWMLNPSVVTKNATCNIHSYCIEKAVANDSIRCCHIWNWVKKLSPNSDKHWNIRNTIQCWAQTFYGIYQVWTESESGKMFWNSMEGVNSIRCKEEAKVSCSLCFLYSWKNQEVTLRWSRPCDFLSQPFHFTGHNYPFISFNPVDAVLLNIMNLPQILWNFSSFILLEILTLLWLSMDKYPARKTWVII